MRYIVLLYRLSVLGIFLSCLFLVGCGKSGHAQVSGTVTLDGKPVNKGVVTFHPLNQQGAVASGTIDTSGRFTLQVGEEHFVPVGEYEITVLATEPLPETSPGEEPGLRDLTPAKYKDTSTSGLRKQLTTGTNTVVLELKSS
jgi:hypothetical protein